MGSLMPSSGPSTPAVERERVEGGMGAAEKRMLPLGDDEARGALVAFFSTSS